MEGNRGASSMSDRFPKQSLSWRFSFALVAVLCFSVLRPEYHTVVMLSHTLVAEESEVAINKSSSKHLRDTSATTRKEETISQSSCCYSTAVDFRKKFDQNFFEEESKRPGSGQLWTGTEYEEWVAFSNRSKSESDDGTPLGMALNEVDTEDCELQWKRTVLNDVSGFYLKHYLKDLQSVGESSGFRYIDDTPGLPRVLLMGDSLSQGSWVWSQAMFGSLANIHSPPNICQTSEQYLENLSTWLGDCPWDLIQFNVGMHYYPRDDGWEPYVQGIRDIVARLRAHSPQAHIVFATTTPSPMDIPPIPTLEVCPNLFEFQPNGAVVTMNELAKNVSEELGITVVDRHQIVLPLVGLYMLLPCDVHFKVEGYQAIAKAEWEVFSQLLNISSSIHSPRGDTIKAIKPSNDVGSADEGASSATHPSSDNDHCCFHKTFDVNERYTKEFFEDQKKENPGLWTGEEYDEWVNFTTTTDLGKALSIQNNSSDCEVEWKRLVLNQNGGFFLKGYLSELASEGSSPRFRYVSDTPGLPRILLLGDSNSMGTWMWSQAMYGDLANIHSGPTSASTLDHFNSTIEEWLGDCPWDLIQFNIGQHFHIQEGETWDGYPAGIRMIVDRLRAHSPEAHIVFATTTPSPMDIDPMPTPESCPGVFYSFRMRGQIPHMNEMAKNVSREMNVTVVDRYAIILPFVGLYMIPCDVHYQVEGYQELARAEWKIHSKLLNLNM